MDRKCFLCGRNGSADPLDLHHIYGNAYRSKSEKYGLTVYLCHDSCHIFGQKSAHRCAGTAQMLRRYGQRKAMAEQGWTAEEFIQQFGKSYI